MRATFIFIWLAAILVLANAAGTFKKTACFKRPDPTTPTPTLYQPGSNGYYNPRDYLRNQRFNIEADEELEDEDFAGYQGNRRQDLRAMINKGRYQEPDEEDEYENEEEDEEEGGRGQTLANWGRRGNQQGNWGGSPATWSNLKQGIQGRMDLDAWRRRMAGRGGDEEEEEEEDEEEEENEQEFDRKKRQVPVISGSVSCDVGKLEKIRIIKVTVGYSHDRICESGQQRCRKDATFEPQVARCNGDGSCDLRFDVTMFGICPLPINFVNVEYECLPEDSTYSVCDWTDAGKFGPAIITSPGYPGGAIGREGTFVTCECLLTTDSGSSITMTSMYSTMSGNKTRCLDDMLLVERKDPADGKKFKVIEELCGKIRREEKALASNVVRLTYLTQISAVAEAKGFQSVFQALRGPNDVSNLRVRCRDLSQGPQGAIPGDLPAVGAAGPSLKDSTQATPTTTVLGSAAGAGAIKGGAGKSEGENKVASAGSQSGGVLSAVVASLASIIVIMGSLTAYFLYRRSQNKKSKSFQQQSVRSTGTDVSWYNDAVYVDPSISQSEKTVPPAKSLVDSATYTSNQEIVTEAPLKSAPPPPPSRPSAPPRKGKKTEETVYDNASVDVDEVYASISDVYDNA